MIKNYISQTKVGKAAWLIVVCLGFLTATLLIGKSYMDWMESPVATSISTHLIESLHFPKVTVCPPHGSNTALYHDLVKHKNHTVVESERQSLNKLAYATFMEDSHRDHMRYMVAAANPENVENVHLGFHSFPKPYSESGLEMRMWTNNGSVRTPWYGETYREDMCLEHKVYHMVLDFPDDLADQVGSGSLVIELDVNTSHDEEEVMYNRAGFLGSKFFTDTLSWADAESYCRGKGGHLASVISEEIHKQLELLVDGNTTWLGGENMGVGNWKWSDNSSWRYTKWSEGMGNNGDNRCVRMAGYYWWDVPCFIRDNFICTATTEILQGSTQTRLEFKKDQLNFPSFHVWYKHRVDSKEMDWKVKRMTGLRLSWRIENPTLVATTSTLGKSFLSPGFGSFKAVLQFPDNLTEQVGNGSLVIDLEVDSEQEEVEYTTGPKYRLFTEGKSWKEAEAHCNKQGLDFASVLSERDKEEVDLVAAGKNVWLGGIFQGGRWQWSDNSTWKTHVNCLNDGTGGNGYCSAWWPLEKGCTYWNCKSAYPFLCSTGIEKISGNRTTRLEYKQEQLKFTSFQVWSKSNTVQIEDSRRNKTGFRLSWFLKDSFGNQVTEIVPERWEDWKPATAIPKYQDPLLENVTALAKQMKLQNVSDRDVARHIFNASFDLIDHNNCLMGQAKHEMTKTMTVHSEKEVESYLDQDDLELGFMMFSVVLHCPEELIKLYKFFDGLVTNDDSTTIIQSTVSTLNSGAILDKDNFDKSAKFYNHLENIFQLQYGKILLSTASKSQIQSILDKRLPFFSKLTQEVESCVNGTNCDAVQEAIQSLGDTFYIASKV